MQEYLKVVNSDMPLLLSKKNLKKTLDFFKENFVIFRKLKLQFISRGPLLH